MRIVLKQHGQCGEFKCSRYYGEDEKHLFIVTVEGGEDGNSTKFGRKDGKTRGRK